MNNFQIESIKVEELFGYYNYKLEKGIGDVSNNLIILYGDNGTGKSTILKILYYLFSNKTRSGHKSKLANIPFRRIEVKLLNGDTIIAERNPQLEQYTGNYTLHYIHDSEDIICPIICKKDDEEDNFHVKISEGTEEYELYTKFLSAFKDLSILYIPDNRKEIGTNDNDDEYIRRKRISRFRVDSHEIIREEKIEKEVGLLQEWIVNRALSATKKGEEGTSEIYAKILSQFSKSKQTLQIKPKLEDIKAKILSIAKKTESYVSMGFISKPDYESVLTMIEKVQQKNVESVYNILSPYMEMQENKLNALDDLVETISHFNNSLNKYLYRKTISYSVSKGFEVKPIGKKDTIDLKNLSSGEKQLILLFSMVIRKSEECPIIIIDEPEISLNIKWQRMLMDTLQYFVKNSNTQFIIATHSFELLSSHTRDTIKLVSKDIEA